MIFRFVTFVLILIPQIGVSEVGFRDLKIGMRNEEVKKYCKYKDGSPHIESIGGEERGIICYENDDYEFTLSSKDRKTVSLIEISDEVNTYPIDSMYEEKDSHYWNLRKSLSEKYTKLDCEKQSFINNFSNGIPRGRDYYRSIQNGQTVWVIVWFSLFPDLSNGIHYTWRIEYISDDHYPYGNTVTDQVVKDCGDFQIKEF